MKSIEGPLVKRYSLSTDQRSFIYHEDLKYQSYQLHQTSVSAKQLKMTNTSSAMEANTSSAKEARLLPLTRSFCKQHPGTWTLANAVESPTGLPLSHDQVSTNPPSVLALPNNPKHLASQMDLIRDLTELLMEDRFQRVDGPEGWTSWFY
ncbi:hypothetical protein N7G274_002641 [Stereocaulon virgatum]|uniref:Uncharacterized protein n=1 Tax=Stereocaulon virgatum TaxID=373712 RepID=A0ABR4AJ78_9LECA